jgi:hypothetical protein
MKTFILAAAAASVLMFSATVASACTPTQPCDGMDPIGKGKGAVPRIGGSGGAPATNNDGRPVPPDDGVDKFIDTVSTALKDVDIVTAADQEMKNARRAGRAKAKREKGKLTTDDQKFIIDFMKDAEN